MNTKTEIPQFYGPAELNRNFDCARPVITECGTYPQLYFKFINLWLKKIIRLILPTYLSNVDSLIQRLTITKLFPNSVPPGARLFPFHAIGMYSNIDTKYTLKVVKKFFEEFKGKITSDTPTDFILETLEIIMF